jgi:hypothetical protein
MVKLGRKDLFNIPPPGRDPDQTLPTWIAEIHTIGPHLSAIWIAKTLNINATKVRHYLTLSLGMKCYHIRLVSHMLIEARKSKSVEIARRMLQELEKYQMFNFHFLLTGNESWMCYQYHHTTM